MEFFPKLKKVLFSPNQFWDDVKGEKGIGEPFRYLVGLLLISGIIFYVVSYLTISSSGNPVQFGHDIATKFGFPTVSGETVLLMLVLISWLTGLISTFVVAGVTHLFVRMFKGTGDYADTYRALVYASTPTALLSSIPVVGSIATLYGLYLQIYGMSKLHRITTTKAVLAYIVPFLIVSLVGIAVSIYLISTRPSQTSPVPSTTIDTATPTGPTGLF